MIQFDEDKQNRKMSDLLKREEEELVQLLSAKYGIEYIDLSVNPINTDALRLIEEKKAEDFLKEKNLNSDDLIIGMSVTVGNKIKQWDLSKFASLADLLVERARAKIIFTGSADDRPMVEKVQQTMQNKSVTAAGFFKLYELPALLKNFKLFISVDSGPLYIANALNVPVVDIGGSGDIQEQAPSGDKCQIVQKNNYRPFQSFIIPIPRSVQEEYFRHLQEITPEDVFEASVKLLEIK